MYIFFLCSGQQIEILRERPDNEHRWEVKSDGEEVGFVLSSSDVTTLLYKKIIATFRVQTFQAFGLHL